jgi:hypothetical protein
MITQRTPKKVDGKLIYDVSDGLPNYSQRNNQYVWQRKKIIVRDANTCNTTSICMAASYAGWRFPKEPFSQYKQEEDRLTALCLEDPRVSDFYKTILPVFWKEWQDGEEDALPPNQVHRVLEYATNLFFGSTVVKFQEDASVNDMLQEVVVEGLPVVISGKFPKSSGSKETIGHIVVLVGAIYDSSVIIPEEEPEFDKVLSPFSWPDIPKPVIEEPESVIIDDPWGNFIEGYEKNLTGNNVICPYELFLKYAKPIESRKTKWAYTFKRGEATI